MRLTTTTEDDANWKIEKYGHYWALYKKNEYAYYTSIPWNYVKLFTFKFNAKRYINRTKTDTRKTEYYK